MITKIGDTAGKIWDTLKENGEFSISKLPKLVNEQDAVTNQALGWLAREGKVDYQTLKNRTKILLTE